MRLYIFRVRNRRLYRALVGNTLLACLLSLIISIIAVQGVVAAAASQLEIISSSQTEFHFKMLIDPYQLDWSVDSDSQSTGCETIQVGIPYGSTPQISIAQGSELIELDPRSFVPENLSPRPRPLADLSDPYTVRGRQLVALRVFPVVDGRVYSEVEIKLSFTGARPASGVTTPDPHFDRIFGASVANFDQVRTWPAAPKPVAKMFATTAGPFAQAGEWYKISVNQTGLHKVTGSQLEAAGLSLADLDSDEIHLYSGGGLPLEVLIDSDWSPEQFSEMSIIVEDGGDGTFGSSDYLLFFGESTDRWTYSASNEPVFIHNPYTDRNVYWLTVSAGGNGLRMATRADGASANILSRFSRRAHLEQDNMLRMLDDGDILDYYNWYWTDEEILSFYVASPGVVDADTARVWLDARTGGSYMDLLVNGVPGFYKSCTYLNCQFATDALVDGANRIDLQLYPSSSAAPYFDNLEIAYTSENIPADDKLDLTVGSIEESARIEVINDFSSTPLILDVSSPLNPKMVTAATVTNDLVAFNAESDGSVFERFYLTPRSQALTPASVVSADPADLYVTDQQVDLLVIAPEVFGPALDNYVAYRRSGGYSVKVVSVEDIMDNFSYGLYDPTAIRNFLKMAYESYPSPAPAAVLFAGDASYDFMDNLGTGTANYVPAYIHPYDLSSSDDNYVYFGLYGLLDSDTSYSPTDPGFDMFCSRWPVKSAEEIATITDKVMRYESAAHFGIWKNKITLVADDEHTSTSSTETVHVIQTETLDKNYIPALFTRDKIYLWEYPFVGNNKPEVNEAIVRAINDGTLIVNYVGHGNPDVWAHEHVLNRADDLPRLDNAERLPLVFAASCAIGFFDHPTREGMAEDFLSLANGGAIGAVSATRGVFSSANAEFNQVTFDILLSEDSLSICEAVYAAKIQRQYAGATPVPITNDRKFLFFGEPFVGLAVPRLDVDFTEAPDTLMALGMTHVTGRVINDDSSTFGSNGVLYVNVYDSERDKVYRLVNSSGVVIDTVAYSVTGPTVYRGSASIENGQFSFDFIAPLDIGYGGEGAKISVYAQFEDIDAAGVVNGVAISDSVASIADSTGPSITVSFTGRHDFVSGDIIGGDEQMGVAVSDPSGVNLTGALGHGITLEIDRESENLVNLTSMYEADRDDFTTGSLTYELADLAPGNHHFKIKAWDNANNSTVYEFDAEVVQSGDFAIKDLLNYPNPMRESTKFSYFLTQRVEKFCLELFTLSGRKIKSFYRYALDPGYYDDIEWYGRDADGSRVATEVYIYKATAYPAGGGEKAESFGKLVLIN